MTTDRSLAGARSYPAHAWRSLKVQLTGNCLLDRLVVLQHQADPEHHILTLKALLNRGADTPEPSACIINGSAANHSKGTYCWARGWSRCTARKIIPALANRYAGSHHLPPARLNLAMLISNALSYKRSPGGPNRSLAAQAIWNMSWSGDRFRLHFPTKWCIRTRQQHIA